MSFTNNETAMNTNAPAFDQPRPCFGKGLHGKDFHGKGFHGKGLHGKGLHGKGHHRKGMGCGKGPHEMGYNDEEGHHDEAPLGNDRLDFHNEKINGKGLLKKLVVLQTTASNVARKLAMENLPADKRDRLETRQAHLEQRITTMTAKISKSKQQVEVRPDPQGSALAEKLIGMQQKLVALKTTASNVARKLAMKNLSADKRDRLEARQAHLEQRITTMTAKISKSKQQVEVRPDPQGSGLAEKLSGMQQKLVALKTTASNVARKLAMENLPADKRDRLEARQTHLEQRIAMITAKTSKTGTSAV